jgi:hypothetical protein
MINPLRHWQSGVKHQRSEEECMHFYRAMISFLNPGGVYSACSAKQSIIEHPSFELRYSQNQAGR